MIKKFIQKWKTKTYNQKKLFFEVYLYTIYFQLLIKLIPFKKISKLNKLINYDSNFHKVNNLSEIYNDIKWSIAAIEKYLPFEPKCLNKALTAQRILQRRKLNGLFYLGVGIDKEENDKFIAHAWLKCNDFIVTGAGNLNKYKVIATYTWN